MNIRKKAFRKKTIIFAFFIILIVSLFILLSPNYEGHENSEEHEHCRDDSDCHGNGSCNNDNMCVCNAGYSSRHNCVEIERPSWWSRTQWDTYRTGEKEAINTVINRYQTEIDQLVNEGHELSLRNSMCPAGEYVISSCSNGIFRHRGNGAAAAVNRRNAWDIPQNAPRRLQKVREMRAFNDTLDLSRTRFWNTLFGDTGTCPSWRCMNEETLEAWRTIAKFYIGSTLNLPNDDVNCPHWREMEEAFRILGYNNLDDIYGESVTGTVEPARNWQNYRDLIFDSLDQRLIDSYPNVLHQMNHLDMRLGDLFTELREAQGRWSSRSPDATKDLIPICNRPTDDR